MGLPAPDYSVPAYRQPLREEVASAFSLRHRRWGKKVSMLWPLVYLVQEQDANTKVEDTKLDTKQEGEQHAKQEREQDTVTEVKFEQDTEVLFAQDTEVKVEQDTEMTVPDAEESEFSVQGTPMPRTPRSSPSSATSEPRTPPLPTSPGNSPSSPTSELSGLSMDIAYQDFCSRRDAFLAQCCNRLL